MNLNLIDKQSQSLSPQMIRSAKVLQMSAQELLEYLSEAVQENPVLELPEVQEREDLPVRAPSPAPQWQDTFDAQERYYSRQDREYSGGLPAECQAIAHTEESLYSCLLSQVQPMKLPPVLMKAVRGILESLDGSGYLQESVEELAKSFHVEQTCMEEALKVIQSLEPAGVGASCLEECLCLQLARQEDVPLAKQIASGHLDALSRGKYSQIAKALSADLKDVWDACDRIRSLNPKPGSGFSDSMVLNYITPDLFINVLPDRLELVVNEQDFRNVRISGYYSHLMQETQDEEVKTYLTEKMCQARELMRSIAQRRETLVRCAECILEVQEPFFRQGAGHLIPMGLRDVAVKLGVHESTVSRAIRNKYIQCNHGIFPMSDFFSRGLGRAAPQDTPLSADKAKALLKQLVQEEDKCSPLSDQKLCAMLSAQKCPISRRTVAKYRDELGIPSAAARKAYEE